MHDGLQVDVRQLVQGLYVQSLDRPWLETPFLFQGFPISSRDEIDTLREHCQYVFVDPLRSDPTALDRVRQEGGSIESGVRPPPLPDRKHREQYDDLGEAFGDEVEPNPARFRELLRAARSTRDRSREFVESVFTDLRLGRMVETSEIQGLVREMVRTISANASASLWLTNLKQRDEYTSIHCVNVCVLALAFGRHLGLSRAELGQLGTGALLHDVGKMLTPDEVLNKPARLSVDEFEIMKRHPVDGYELMRDTGRVSLEALAIIRHHHERVEGQGYPDGLRGEQIPLTVMITALADVYDALTSDRVYRGGLTSDQALRMMYHNAARHYGQEIVEEFIRCLGIYPVGCVVELRSGALGVVITSHRYARLLPVVVLIRTPAGEPYEKRVIVNLGARAQEGKAGDWTVRRVVDAADYYIEVAAVIAAEIPD